MTNFFQQSSLRALLQPASWQQRGRQLQFGFSWSQRPGKPGVAEVWFPPHAQPLPDGTPPHPIEWVAFRQIELLRDAGNLSIEDLKVEDLRKAYRDILKMRAGGTRAVVAVAGSYATATDDKHDELQQFDGRLREALQQLVDIFWLDELAAQESQSLQQKIVAAGGWQRLRHLPQLAHYLSNLELSQPACAAMKAATPKQVRASLQQKLLNALLQLAEQLGKNPRGGSDVVAHELLVGLQLPQLSGEHHWLYVPEDTMTANALQRTLSTVFRGFDCYSLRGLDMGTFTPEVMPSMLHLKGYQGRLQAA